MNAIRTGAAGRGRRHWGRLAALALAGWGAAVLAQVVSVPDAHLNHVEGSVAHAPPGEREWQDITPPRLLVRGDRLWTDRGSRAEVQAGGHALRLDGQTQLTLENASADDYGALMLPGGVKNPDTMRQNAAGVAFVRHFADAMLELYRSSGVAGVPWLEVGVIAAWGVIGVVLALRFFSWEPRR